MNSKQKKKDTHRKAGRISKKSRSNHREAMTEQQGKAKHTSKKQERQEYLEKSHRSNEEPEKQQEADPKWNFKQIHNRFIEQHSPPHENKRSPWATRTANAQVPPARRLLRRCISCKTSSSKSSAVLWPFLGRPKSLKTCRPKWRKYRNQSGNWCDEDASTDASLRFPGDLYWIYWDDWWTTGGVVGLPFLPHETKRLLLAPSCHVVEPSELWMLNIRYLFLVANIAPSSTARSP